MARKPHDSGPKGRREGRPGGDRPARRSGTRAGEGRPSLRSDTRRGEMRAEPRPKLPSGTWRIRREAPIGASQAGAMRSRHKPDRIIRDHDFPSAEDLLGFKKRGQSLIHLLERIDPPMSILLDGEPGSGKSSFLQLIAHEIETSSDLAPAWVHAVNYNDQAFLLPPIFTQLARDYGRGPEFQEFIARFSTAYYYAVASRERMLGKLQEASSYDTLRSRIEFNIGPSPAGMDAFMAVDLLQETFLHFVQAVLPKAQKRSLIVFVDDLDCCQPDSIDRFFYDLFALTAVPGSKVIWIIALDVNGYATQSKNAPRLLSKAINLRLKVPALSAPRALLSNHFTALGGDGKALATPASQACEACEITNPRLIKRVGARLSYWKASGGLPKGSNELDFAIALCLLHEAYPEAYRAFLNDPGAAIQLFVQLSNTAVTPNYSAGALQGTLKQPFREDLDAYINQRRFQLIMARVAILAGKIFNLRSGAKTEAIGPLNRLLRGAAELL